MPVYLDYAASAPLKAGVKAAMVSAMDRFGNASSVHAFGRQQRAKTDAARAMIAQTLNVKDSQIVFTGGATEANNMALHSQPDRRIITSAIEHPSVLQAGGEQVGVDANGTINLNHLESLLKASPALVSLMLVNNETGVIQPIAEAAKLVHAAGGLLHVDAVQAFGKLPVDFQALEADMLSLSAHKIGGPQGVGALVVRDKLAMEPFMRGGGQEQRRRAGTENVVGICGLAAAFESLGEDLARAPEWAGWRDAMEQTMLKAAPDVTIFGQKSKRVATISCIAMPGMKNETQLMAFDLAGYAVSSGSACSSGKVQASHVLKAMNVPEQIAMNAIRTSFGPGTVSQDLTGFAQVWSAQAANATRATISNTTKAA